MPRYTYRLVDNNTGEEVYPSDGFAFAAPPVPEHRIHDPEIMARYGGPAIVDRVEESEGADGTIEVSVYIDAVEEVVSGDLTDENYRRS
ncbi:hypothetical protein [Asticcacaulis solisilvae]|uniref:hypothetical protein n=1 Tax=Asticcacaulis solisilvae TaxID=1217274 RepID=UPI003FD856C0